jgi:hypothetical protein
MLERRQAEGPREGRGTASGETHIVDVAVQTAIATTHTSMDSHTTGYGLTPSMPIPGGNGNLIIAKGVLKNPPNPSLEL